MSNNKNLTWSDQAPIIEVESHKAWRIFGALLRIGRPAFPSEIASQCEATPDLVRQLCSIPNSPIRLLDDGLVTVSIGVAASTVSKPLIYEPKRVWSFDLKTYYRKRKRNEFDRLVLSMPAAKRRLILPSRRGVNLGEMNQIDDAFHEEKSGKDIIVEASFLEANACLPIISVEADVSTKLTLPKESFGFVVERETHSKPGKSFDAKRFILPNSSSDSFSEIVSKNKADNRLTFFSEGDRQHDATIVETGLGDYYPCEILLGGLSVDFEHQTALGRKKGGDDQGRKKGLKLSLASKRLFESSRAQNDSFLSGSQVIASNSRKEKNASKVEAQASTLQIWNPSSQMQASKCLTKNFLPHRGVLTESSEYNRDLNILQRNDQKFLYLKGDSENMERHKAGEKENTLKTKTVSHKENQAELKEVPKFDDFIIEDEEGSGGYGTVYRARRNSDGKMCAIKCPHAKAHKNHITNELKMLERFGGRNFIVKYEGSVKKGDTECFVLEHVDHDRPEVLKKEIDLFQLQWYAYCLFRALSFLHKQAVVHRDVKPGNFLFSRKLNKGVLVDFNLSMDLQQKLAVGSKSKSSSCLSSYVPPPHPKSSQSTKDNKVVTGIHLAGNLQDATKHKKPSHERRKSLKKMASSGLNSTKEVTSTRTPSTERATREPLPSLGRKELISLVQDAMQSPNQDDSLKTTQFSQRKRIAAPPTKIWYMSPMPLYSNCVAVAGAGLLKNKGDGKRKTEGPCFGTKGFRAPEVLFRSQHQGPKIDVWSAGVTILCLMIGRSPFTGEPEQNIKEIAKLRGSEDLWEVAKLHDRESSFPMELMDTRFLQATELESWCKAHTRRPEFLKLVPRSLFDLMDKCLAVNPRLRISAEEALRHEFFASCNESMTKQRMLRHGLKCPEDHK